MRNMSFRMTVQQVKDETKDVTRRISWWFLKPGDRVQAVVKGMGLKKGEKIQKLKVIEIVSTRKEILCTITKNDCIREGFPDLTPCEFVKMLCDHSGVLPSITVNRIEFKYI